MYPLKHVTLLIDVNDLKKNEKNNLKFLLSVTSQDKSYLLKVFFLFLKKNNIICYVKWEVIL